MDNIGIMELELCMLQAKWSFSQFSESQMFSEISKFDIYLTKCTLKYSYTLSCLIQMAMLLKLQESANFVESPEGDLSGEPNFQATL